MGLRWLNNKSRMERDMGNVVSERTVLERMRRDVGGLLRRLLLIELPWSLAQLGIIDADLLVRLCQSAELWQL